jgi:alcohol dehydrogenase class IV
MLNLNYLMPVRVIMGEDCLFQNRSFLAALGKKAFIVTGQSSARANGSLDDAIRALEANGQGYALFDRVMNNPTETCVYEAAAECKAAGCGFVLAIGGGSPLDAAKGAAILALNDIPKEAFFGLSFDSALPLVCVPTTAGTGSETTPYSVLVDTGEADDARFRSHPKYRAAVPGPVKRSAGSPLMFPRAAFLDARYMRTLGRDVTVHTALDALSHAIEGMLTLRANYLSDILARDALALILPCLKPLLAFPARPEDFPLELREKLLLGSTVAGMVIAQSGTAAPHSMGYHFTLNWGTAHGRANGLLMKPFLEWCRARENAGSSAAPRIPALCAALGMELESFLDIIERLLGTREQASEAELAVWGAAKMKNAANTYIQPGQDEIFAMFRAATGGAS